MRRQAGRASTLRSEAIWLACLRALALVLLVGLAKTGVLGNGVAPDTGGYLAAAASDNPRGGPLMVPFIVQSGIRQRVVGDFNLVSFGGFQMSAMAGFMLTPEMAERFRRAISTRQRRCCRLFRS